MTANTATTAAELAQAHLEDAAARAAEMANLAARITNPEARPDYAAADVLEMVEESRRAHRRAVDNLKTCHLGSAAADLARAFNLSALPARHAPSPLAEIIDNHRADYKRTADRIDAARASL